MRLTFLGIDLVEPQRPGESSEWLVRPDVDLTTVRLFRYVELETSRLLENDFEIRVACTKSNRNDQDQLSFILFLVRLLLRTAVYVYM